jgi:kynurenine formamidase
MEVNGWIDVSVSLRSGMVHWPDNPPVRIDRALLEAGIWVIEGLNLSEVKPGEYELICLPVKIERSDGTPARAILRTI